jgi:hypothetical protein
MHIFLHIYIYTSGKARENGLADRFARAGMGLNPLAMQSLQYSKLIFLYTICIFLYTTHLSINIHIDTDSNNSNPHTSNSELLLIIYVYMYIYM